MTTVWSNEDETFAVDWDWRDHFTVWTLTGRHFEARYGERVLERELPSRPSGERAAESEARRWWRDRGQSEVRAQGS